MQTHHVVLGALLVCACGGTDGTGLIGTSTPAPGDPGGDKTGSGEVSSGGGAGHGTLGGPTVGTPSAASPAAGGSATPSCGIDVRLEGPSAADVSAIVVTVARVEVQESGVGWTTLTTAAQTLDLLAPGGASLGTVALPVGHVTSIRLVLEPSGASTVTTKDGVSHALDVPSGTTSGMQVSADFDVPACASGQLTLGIDGGSVALHPVGAGAGDRWVLRPVLQLDAVAIH